MKFAVGYQHIEDGEPFASIVADYREHISEVYFAWVGQPSGRPVLGATGDDADPELQLQLEEELQLLRQMGIKLDLLLNANCYGERAVSVAFENEVVSIIKHLDSRGCFPGIVTTTSFMIARTIKKHFSKIEVRASVNMRVGTIQALGYLEELFDSFYLQRDLQRNIKYTRKIHDWCKQKGKKICILANSGCLRFCPAQTFHDNLIAHSEEAEKQKNIPDWNPHLCWNLYNNPENYVESLKSTWIRPEDLSQYDGIVDTVKLATRQHAHPRMVIGAYAEGSFCGNLLDLLEPGFSPAFAPRFIDNTAFPSDWGKHISECDSVCESCGYCDEVLKQVLASF